MDHISNLCYGVRVSLQATLLVHVAGLVVCLVKASLSPRVGSLVCGGPVTCNTLMFGVYCPCVIQESDMPG